MLSWGVLGYPGVSWGNQTDRLESYRKNDPEIGNLFLAINLEFV